jgi:hypothetical protein
MTRNARRMSERRARRTVTPAPVVEPMTVTSKRIRVSDVPALMRHDAPRRHKPRNTWRQPGWSGVSPYWHNMTTIDRRWDK